MAIKEIEGFNYMDIKKKLLIEGKSARCLVTIVDFVFSDCIVDLMDELNSEFPSSLGNRAFPRSMLLGVYLYCLHFHNHNLSDMARECEINNVLRIFTCGKSPSMPTLKRFLSNSDSLIMKNVFLYTLVQLNDLGLLNFLRAFVDGTDALVNGSKHYTLTRDELEALQLMKKWKLSHNNSFQSKNRVKMELLRKQRRYKYDKKISETIGIILGRLDLYNKKIFKRIKEFKRSFNETDKDYICISFPSAVMMPTKKGNFDFGFNIQEIMTENNIIITGLISQKPNDNLIMEELLTELKENFKILLELIEKYGCRRNYKEIKQMLKKAIFVFDSGYFSDNNLESMDKHEINGLIMPKIISRQNNNKLRAQNDLPTKEKNYNLKKYGKKDFTRVNNGYLCKKGYKLELNKIKPINSKTNNRKGISDSWKEQSYIHECQACTRCSIKDKCLQISEFKTITDRVSPLKYEMTNKFTQQRYLNIYKERFHISEGINGYLKNTNGILHLIGSNKVAAKNEIQLRNTMYNLTRMKNLKGTAY